MSFRRLAVRALVIGAVAFGFPAVVLERAIAGGGRFYAPVADPVVKEECGGCHLAFPPSMLPASSWRRMMGELENHFGDLNENQEEMLGAARLAADTVDGDLAALRRIADLDRGILPFRRDRLRPGDLVRALIPMLQAAADKAGATLRVDIEPVVPAIHGDQAMLQESLAALLGGLLVVAVAVGVVESVMARLRLSRVPQLLVGAGALALLAIVLLLH